LVFGNNELKVKVVLIKNFRFLSFIYLDMCDLGSFLELFGKVKPPLVKANKKDRIHSS
jgi:hypothetical protein